MPDLQGTPADRPPTTLSIERANALGLVLMPILIFFLGVPYGMIHGFDSLLQPLTEWKNLLLALPVFLLSILLHEGLHGLGFIFFSEATSHDVSYGVKWEALTPYAHCEIPVKAFAYRVALVMPTVILGMMPFLVGLLTGSPRWAIYGIIMTIAGVGDLLALWVIRHVPNDVRVQDHPSEVGCDVLWESAP